MAVTHNDLVPRNRGYDVTSQRGLLLMVFSVLSGFASFILCLAAEATRSEVTWLLLSSDQLGKLYECYYSGSGKTPLICAVVAFFTLAVAMFTEHGFILITISGPRPPALVAWTLREDMNPPPSASTLRWQACSLFLATWVSFAIAEVLLMVGISVEASHLTDWRKPRTNCVAARPGLFAAAGVFGLTTVFLAVLLYLTALRAQRAHHGHENHTARPHQQLPTTAPTAPPSSNQQQQQQQQLQHQPARATSVRVDSSHLYKA